MLLGMFLMGSCARQDEELQRQLIEMRATLESRNKAMEQLQSQVGTLQSQSQQPRNGASSADAAELAKAREKIAELEKRIALLQTNPTAPPALGKIDMDAMAEKLEDDLTRKAKQLRELVQKQSSGSRIDEISLKAIEYPPQLVTPFTSAITFTVAEEGGRSLRLQFPVSADLGGAWKLPTPDEVQQAYKAAQQQPAGAVVAGGGAAPAPQGNPAQSGGAPAHNPGAPSMTQRSDGVFVFDWGDGTAPMPRAAQPQPQPQTQAPRPATPAPAPAPLPNTAPPAVSGLPPQPAAPPAAPAQPSVPAPVMPTVGDRIIRFND